MVLNLAPTDDDSIAVYGSVISICLNKSGFTISRLQKEDYLRYNTAHRMINNPQW